MTHPAPSDKAGFLQIKQLHKRFDSVTAVDDVSLDIGKGEIFALLGSSGCGKSTLLRMLAGFETPTSGQIFLGEQDISLLPAYERPINMMFQSYALFPHLTVWENIAFGLRRMGMDKDSMAERVQAMLDLVQLQKFASRKPHQLSGGQQQRVALARSLARKPQLLLLDEPLGALDKKLREQTQFELVNIIESIGVTCVMVTHDQEEAMTMASRIAVMSQGRILQLGSPTEIYEAPNCRFVADFIGNVNMFEGQLTRTESSESEIRTPQGTFTLGHGTSHPQGMALALAVRPEKIQINKQPPAQGAAHAANVVSGVVREIAYMGSYSTYVVQLPDQSVIKSTQTNRSRNHEGDIVWGDTVYCYWGAQAGVLLSS
ncbi:MAG: ABC transporter ATP-binding protein [Limnohabitans sp.]|jgi:putrescine transport system ATP-binding protein